MLMGQLPPIAIFLHPSGPFLMQSEKLCPPGTFSVGEFTWPPALFFFFPFGEKNDARNSPFTVLFFLVSSSPKCFRNEFQWKKNVRYEGGGGHFFQVEAAPRHFFRLCQIDCAPRHFSKKGLPLYFRNYATPLLGVIKK